MLLTPSRVATELSSLNLIRTLVIDSQLKLVSIALPISIWQSTNIVCHFYLPITKAKSAFHPSGVGKWVAASAGKAKAGMVHSVSGWRRGVQVKLWERVPYLSALEVCSWRGAIQIHVYLTLLYPVSSLHYTLCIAYSALTVLPGVSVRGRQNDFLCHWYNIRSTPVHKSVWIDTCCACWRWWPCSLLAQRTIYGTNVW